MSSFLHRQEITQIKTRMRAFDELFYYVLRCVIEKFKRSQIHCANIKLNLCIMYTLIITAYDLEESMQLSAYSKLTL